MEKISSPEAYIERNLEWKELLESLRDILLESGLEEKMKWSIPTYCVDNKNVVGLAAFKEYCGLWFFYGAILSDPKGVLENAQEDTKHMRSWRFSADEKLPKADILGYVKEAADKVDLAPKPEKKGKKVEIPKELEEFLDGSPQLKTQFLALSPFKQREYCEHIASAKQEGTKLRRLSKMIPLLEKGIGLHDKYRNC